MFSQSEFLKKEYACEIVKIGKVEPIENSDFLAKTEIHPGMPIVVRKDEVHEGDVMFYVDMECQICPEFLHINNQYEDPSMNMDPNVKGYINKTGRVRMVKLRGQESMGYLFSKEAMQNYLRCDIKDDFDMVIGTVFDTVNGKEFVKAYVPTPKRMPGNSHQRERKRNKHLKLFDRIIPGEFQFHYDTDQLEKCIDRISPHDVLDISVKMHGTSAIFANVLVNRKLNIWEKIKKFFGLNVPTREYGNIYSSRGVIKNQYINQGVTSGYYGEDLWGFWNEKIKDYIPKGMTIYGEIVGYTPGGQAIQKSYDYGCGPNESKLMIYRINKELEDGTHYEYNVGEVKHYTEFIIKKMHKNNDDTTNYIIPIPIVYHGTLDDRYHIPINDEWYSNILHVLAADTNFYMEMNEPMCQHKVPREGLVIRKYNDPLKEAFKLKTMKFRNKEAKSIDAGEVDIEMQEVC